MYKTLGNWIVTAFSTWTSKLFMHCSVFHNMIYDKHLQNVRKITNLYSILPTSGCLMVLREKDNKAKVYQNYWTAIAAAILKWGTPRVDKIPYFPALSPAPVKPAHTCWTPLFWKDKSRSYMVSLIYHVWIHWKKTIRLLPKNWGKGGFWEPKLILNTVVLRLKWGWYFVLLIPHWSLTLVSTERWAQARNNVWNGVI